MADAEDAHDIVLEEEQDAVVAEAEAESPGHFAMQRRYLVSGKSSGFCPNSASRSSIGKDLASVLSKPGLTFTEGAALLLGDWLFLIVNHDFTEMNVREARRSGGCCRQSAADLLMPSATDFGALAELRLWPYHEF